MPKKRVGYPKLEAFEFKDDDLITTIRVEFERRVQDLDTGERLFIGISSNEVYPQRYVVPEDQVIKEIWEGESP